MPIKTEIFLPILCKRSNETIEYSQQSFSTCTSRPVLISLSNYFGFLRFLVRLQHLKLQNNSEVIINIFALNSLYNSYFFLNSQILSGLLLVHAKNVLADANTKHVNLWHRYNNRKQSMKLVVSWTSSSICIFINVFDVTIRYTDSPKGPNFFCPTLNLASINSLTMHGLILSITFSWYYDSSLCTW